MSVKHSAQSTSAIHGLPADYPIYVVAVERLRARDCPPGAWGNFFKILNHTLGLRMVAGAPRESLR